VSPEFPEGVYAAQKQEFDIVIADMHMPGSDGLTFLREVHGLQKTAHFFVLSSYLYLQKYRDGIRSLGFPVTLLDKDLPPADNTDLAAAFVEPFLAIVAKDSTRKSLWKRFVDATELKPGMAGFSVDLKRLLEKED
jgi:CheY-like chemotaxis protein